MRPALAPTWHRMGARPPPLSDVWAARAGTSRRTVQPLLRLLADSRCRAPRAAVGALSGVALMHDEPLHIGDDVAILPSAAPPVGQPPAPGHYGVVVAVDSETGRATVRLVSRRYTIEVPLDQLRRVT
jgi:hypothetical protein